MTSGGSERTFLLPDLGEGLTEGEVVAWLVSEGDVVALDQTVVEVETAKSVVEVPSPYAGRVVTLHAKPGETVDVGKPLITISTADDEGSSHVSPGDDAGSAVSREAEAYRKEEQAGSGNVLIGYGTSGETGAGRRRRARRTQPSAVAVSVAPTEKRPVKVISPLVRAAAREAGLNLGDLSPSGAGGVLTRADIERAISAPRASEAATATVSTPPAPAPGERRTPLNGFRKAVSAALSRSRSEIPEATVWVDVDATALWEVREAARTPIDPGPGLLAYLARFVVAALKEYPVLNSRLDTERDEIVEYDSINLGIAVQGERGLVVPAVVGADSMTTSGLDKAIRDITGRAREGKTTAEELAAGTFTLNNYGGFRVDGSAAIINHPQVAIMGLGRVIDRPWVVDGQIVARKITQMSFVFDHRVCDGGTAAGFMRSVADAIENPAAAIARL
jgi:2-oxoisovalerate dehydrogenase E2 component (dihydrolipoyl transacylase)